MDEIDRTFREAVEDGRIHGAVLIAKDLEGKVDIKRTYGVRSLRAEDPKDRPPMEATTPMRIASASKFLSSIMVLQCVEAGKVSLDETLGRLLPEVAAFKVITGFDNAGNPMEREPKSPATVRQLLSHSAGLTYAITDPNICQYRQKQGRPLDQGFLTLDENFGYPLVYDPGTDWAYSPGLDWSSRLLSRASGMPCEAFLQAHIAGPLGISSDDMTFELQKHPTTQERRADSTVRGPDGKLAYTDENYWHRDNEPHGGQGIYTTPEAYMKVLWSILSDDGKLLKHETRQLLFEPALSAASEKGLMDYSERLKDFKLGSPIPLGVKKSHSVGGLLTLEDCDGDRFRRKGNLSWSGLPNQIWSIDPEPGVCLLWFFHIKPWGDSICHELGEQFERVVYAALKQ